MKNGKTEFVGTGTDFYKTIEHAVENSDYKEWFTNFLAKEYIAALPERYNSSKDANRRFSLYIEAEKVAQIYAMLVYYIYPSKPSFRKEIDSNRELSANFAMVKEWMDKNGGRGYAESVLGLQAGKMTPENSS